MKNKTQLLRFGVIGGVNTILDFGLLFFFQSLGLPISLANIMSTGIAFVFSFFANKNYTFHSTSSNILREMTLFIVVTLFGLWVIQTGIIQWILPFATNTLHNKDVALFASKLVATVVSMVWNYILYDRLVFDNR